MSVTIPEATSAPTPPRVGDGASLLPHEVREFCLKYGLAEYLPETLRLLREEFAPVGEIEMQIKDDAEEEFTRLVLNIPVVGEVSSVVACFTGFLERWIPVTTPDVRMRIVVIWTFHT